MIHHASRRSFLACLSGRRISGLIAMAVLLLPPIVRAADAPAVTPSEQLQFQQKYIQAQMQELQERMFRLADLTREAEPDDSARLLVAVRRAREQLIIEQMKQAIDLLSASDFNRATGEQTEIIAKLEELKKLLTSSSMDLQLLLQRLKALNRAIAKLEQATKEEKRQVSASKLLADEQANKPNPPKEDALKNAQQTQQQNRKATESIAESVKTMGGQAAAAGASLGSASQAMALAEGKLSSGSASGAAGSQSEAVSAMQDAQKKLAEERERIQMELEKMVRAQVVMNLKEMLDRQQSVRAGTEPIVNAADFSQRQTLLKLKQLGNTETSIVRISDQTIELIDATGFSVALPPALKRVGQKCAVIAATLNDSKANPPLVTAMAEVEQDIKDLLETFKELSASKVKDGNCNCKGDKNKLLAELKVIRLMQTRVNTETKTVDGQRTSAPAFEMPANIDPMLREKIVAVHDGQADVHDAMQKIQDQLNAPDPQPQEEAQ